jgi:putative chitinase
MSIKIGSKGDDVKKIQEKLGLKADGIFGTGTESAVKSFQLKSGLKADGIVDTYIWSKIFENKSETVSNKLNISKLNISKLKGHIPDNVYLELEIISQKFNIINSLRLSHFLSQCAHESGDFKALQENLNYSTEGLVKIFGKYFNSSTATGYARNPEKIASRVYASRMGNGDESSKEGWKFRGRGYIQLTGKSNYIAFGKFIGEDVLNNPDLVATKYPLSSAAFFFNSNNLWTLCDKGSDIATITAVTKRVNGGTHGLQDRINKFKKYWSLLSN